MAETKLNSGKAIDRRMQVRFAIRNTVRCLILAAAVLALPCGALPIRDALGMIESGNDDHAVGSAGEISRYQIKKDIWQAHSCSSEFWNEKEAWRVAEKVLAARVEEYRRGTGRTPAPFDLYVLWNAPGHFRGVGYEQKRISRVVAERATRFANLVGAPTPGTAGMEKDEKTAVAADGVVATPQLAIAVAGRK